jgi:hypothetical protein
MDNEQCSFLGCGVVWVLLELSFRRNVPPPSSRARILCTLKKEDTLASEMPVQVIPTRRHILEDVILHIHRREKFKSYMQGKYSLLET